MENLKFAAIDIGSNAVRLLIKGLTINGNDATLNKVQLFRVPLRLGQDVFVSGSIGVKSSAKLMKLMKAFKHLMYVYDVTAYKACATSAMRDASDARDIVKMIKKETDIKIDIITGQEEAAMIYESHFADQLNPEKNYLYVDVGGGSTELSLIVDGKLRELKSFNIGTVRLLNQKVEKEEFVQFKEELKSIRENYQIQEIIGSGGNIIKLHALAKPLNGKISLNQLESLYDEMRKFNSEELVRRYKLKPDRADVILHAAKIYIEVATECGCNLFSVPSIGLSDGIIHTVYTKWKNKNPNVFNDIWY
jgi:exopolyphosphatase / guanosine-5'-triphosphate,3'-diphosphate pyrophosphatase